LRLFCVGRWVAPYLRLHIELVRGMMDALTAAARVERVVMLALLQILLSQFKRYAPFLWIAVLFAAIFMCASIVIKTVSHGGALHRVMCVVQRLALYIVIHAVMRGSMPPNKGAMFVLLYGVAVLGALALLPRDKLPQNMQAQLSSQITYAYATAAEGVLVSLRENRTFVLLALTLLFVAPRIETQFAERVAIAALFFEAFDLVVFDTFTDAFFLETGDNLADIAVIVFVFVLLWHVQERFDTMQSIQQFTTWRIAGALQSELDDLAVPRMLATAAGVATLAVHLPRSVFWLQPLTFLLTLNILLTTLQGFLDDMGTLDTLPVLLSIAVVTATASELLSA
jgi:hypothetical protein